LYSVRPILSELHWNTLRDQIGNCGRALAGDMPVYKSFYAMLRRNTGEKRCKLSIGETGMDFLARGMQSTDAPVTPAARASFFVAFDVTPDEQIALEAFYDTVSPTFNREGVARGFHLNTKHLIRTTHPTTQLH
jgi:hypothetical protein